MATTGLRLLPREEQAQTVSPPMGRTQSAAGATTRDRHWPDAVAYREAIQHPTASLNDPFFAGATVALDRRGLPLSYTGRFAVVFRITRPDGSLWAVRCYTDPPRGEGDSRAARFARLEPTLRQSGVAGLFAPFRYLPEGIQVAGQRYPVLAMPWLEGEPLGRFVEKNRENPAALLTLARALGVALEKLTAAGIAHGDWQHDNILVSQGGRRIALVDYDGVFTPELAHSPPAEQGHPNYQHPARGPGDYHASLDAFPCLLIQTALTALAVEPSLWDSFSDGESLIFHREDLLDPSNSTAFATVRLVSHTAPELGTLLRFLEDACRSGSNIAPAAAPSALFAKVAARLGVIVGSPSLEPTGAVAAALPATSSSLLPEPARQQGEEEATEVPRFNLELATLSTEARRWFETVRRGLNRQAALEQIHLWSMRLVWLTLIWWVLLQPDVQSPGGVDGPPRFFLSLFLGPASTAIGFYLWPRNLEGIAVEDAMEMNESQLKDNMERLSDYSRRLFAINRNPANLSAIAYVAATLQSVYINSPETTRRVGLTAEEREALLAAGIERLSDLPASLPVVLPARTAERFYAFKSEVMVSARAAYELLAQERRTIQQERDRLETERLGLLDTDQRLRWRIAEMGSGSLPRFLLKILTGM